jgi:2,3-dihydro-2,3-dihydroxybenzoate dehydrogenase
MRDSQFAGTVALVTGAAGGIGEAVTLALAHAGAAVAAVDVDEADLGRLAVRAGGAAGSVTGFTADVGAAAQVEQTVAAVEERLGPIEFLVNCAGVLRAAPVLSLTEQEWDDTFSVNVRGTFLVSSAVARRMVERRRGAVVTVASNAAAVPRMRMAAYGASKAAATAFTKSLGLELAGSGIRCNVVAPGSTDTTMLRSLWDDDNGLAKTVNGAMSEYRVGIPIGRIAAPANVADAVMFLLSDGAAHITMHDLYVDGGAALGR